MGPITMVVGALLIVLGVTGYELTNRISATALIPAGFGLPILLLGALALKEGLRKHAMHGAVVLGLLGFLGSLRGVVKAIQLLSAGEALGPGVIAQLLMCGICLLFVALCVRSFIAARRARQAVA